MKKAVIVPRGIPGAGKTTWVKEQMALLPAGTAVRINNDDLSASIYGRPLGDFFFSDATRDTLHNLRLAMLETFLQQDAVTHIYVDNTNLATQTVKALFDVAVKYDADFIVDDTFLAVPVEECIARDALRDKPVGADVIQKMWKTAGKLKPWTAPYEVPAIAPYQNLYREDCVIVDIDGTLAHMTGRSPYDYDRVIEDDIDYAVREVVTLLHDEGTKIVVMSGRDDDSMDVTVAWLKKHNVPYHEIYMRKTGDHRPDWIVKNELFQEHIADKYDVFVVLDDRNQVVNLWRNKLGLKTWQVADGNF